MPCGGEQAARDQLLAVGGDDPSEVHSALSKLSILGRLTTEELAQQAVRLFKRAPAAKLLRHRDFELHWCASRGLHQSSVRGACDVVLAHAHTLRQPLCKPHDEV